MNSINGVDIALSIAVLAAVGLTLTIRSRKTQVMAFLGLGVIASLVWFRLSNLDVGLAEAALGSGILSAALVGLVATQSSERSQAAQQYQQHQALPRWLSAALGATSGIIIMVVIANIWWRVEQQVPLWDQELDPAMQELPVDHGITGVLLSFRAYDTLLESAVLMFAALVARALLPDGSLRAATQSHPNATGLTHTLSFSWAFRLLAPVLLLLGLWLLFAGTSEPGGAFQSGAVIAGMLIMLHIADVRMDHLIRYWLAPLLIVGVTVFTLASALGPMIDSAWLTWPTTGAYAVILTVETTLTAGIAAALFLLYLAVIQPAEDIAPQSQQITQETNS